MINKTSAQQTNLQSIDSLNRPQAEKKEAIMNAKTTTGICGAYSDHPSVGAPGCTKDPNHDGNHGPADGSTRPSKRPAFITQAEIVQREAIRLAQIDDLRSMVKHLDDEPLVPDEAFDGGNRFEGFFAGKIVAKSSDYLAIWSKLSNRVAILPYGRIDGTPNTANAIVAIHAWGSEICRCVPLTPDYGWLDAFDDFAVEFQRTRRDWRMDLSTAGLSSDCFVLDDKREVASWYRDRPAFFDRELC